MAAAEARESAEKESAHEVVARASKILKILQTRWIDSVRTLTGDDLCVCSSHERTIKVLCARSSALCQRSDVRGSKNSPSNRYGLKGSNSMASNTQAPWNSARHSSSSRERPRRKSSTVGLFTGKAALRRAPTREEREATTAKFSSSRASTYALIP